MGIKPDNLRARLDAIEAENERLRVALHAMVRLLDQAAQQIGVCATSGIPSVLHPLAP